MRRRRSISGTLINTAVFIILEIAALHLLGSNGNIQDFFISRAAHGFMGKVWGTTESVKYFFSLKKENERLAEEVLDLTRQLSSLDDIAEEKLTLSDPSLDIEHDSRFTFQAAEIIKNSTNKQHNYFILGKGSEDGVTPQSGVITSKGVVGIIDAVSKHYSYAISFLNTDSSISARIGNDGAVGPMTWDGIHQDGALLREIPLQHRFEPGDTVYTSGYSSIFPPNIPLGTTGESRIVNGATYEIQIRMFQNFSALRHVMIVCNKDIAEIEGLGNGPEAKQKNKGKR